MEQAVTQVGLPTGEHVVVALGGSRYAVPMASVAEVGRPAALTRVPGLPEWVAGVANWRGRVLGVLDLRPLLQAPRDPLDRRARLVVLSQDGVTVGLLVEAVHGSIPVAAESVEPPLAHLPPRTAGLLAGQLTVTLAEHSGPCALLAVDAVFALAGELPKARRAS